MFCRCIYFKIKIISVDLSKISLQIYKVAHIKLVPTVMKKDEGQNGNQRFLNNFLVVNSPLFIGQYGTFSFLISYGTLEGKKFLPTLTFKLLSLFVNCFFSGRFFREKNFPNVDSIDSFFLSCF